MISARPVTKTPRLRQTESSVYAPATRCGSRLFQASSAACTFCAAVSAVNGGSGGRSATRFPPVRRERAFSIRSVRRERHVPAAQSLNALFLLSRWARSPHELLDRGLDEALDVVLGAVAAAVDRGACHDPSEP